MSLHALAGHMAAKGRGSDSMLVHMTPEEVQSLQVLALKNGGSLTINPDTGLPEANFLKKLLPAIAGAALNFFAPGVGTAVGGMFGLGGAAGAGIAIGGITSLATGSLSRGLMAGLGAYGGASLAGGVAGAGAGAAQDAAMSGLTQEQIAQQIAEKGLTEQGVLNQAAANATTDFMAKSAGDRLMEGATAAFNDPKAFVQGMGGLGKTAQAGLAAISPIMADEGVQTATQRPDTGTIRNYTFDPYGQTYTSAGNYPASEYKGMAQGGIVALAAGGDYRSLTKDSSADDIASAYKQFTTGAGGDTKANQDAARAFLGDLGIGQDRIGEAYGKFQAAPTYTQFSNEQIGSYLAANPKADIAAETARLNADPRAVNQYISQLGAGFLDPTQSKGGSGSGQYYDVFSKYGIDANELSAANTALNPNLSADERTKYAEDMARAFETAKDFKGFDPAGDTQLAKDVEWVKKMDTEGATAFDIARLTGLSIGEVKAREAAARAAMLPVTDIVTDIGKTEKTKLPDGVSGGGNTVINPNGTITTTPNIPGRPEGGFTGMGQVRDAYTAGGGSLGYTNRAPKTMEEFNERFNRQTGDSLNAYEYLMGKGANNNAYPTKSGVAQIMRPYSEVTTGIPVAEGRPTQKYIFQGGKYVENPNYRPLSYNSKGERIVGLTSAEVLKGLAPFKTAADDAAMFDFVTENRITEAQLAAALGIPITEARARIAAGKTKSTGTTATAPAEGAANGGVMRMALGGLGALAGGGQAGYNLGGYSDGGRLLRGPGDGVSDSIPATIGDKQPARLADGEFVVPARIVSELGNGSTEAGARKLYAMMDRVQKARGKTTGKRRVAANTRSEKYLPA